MAARLILSDGVFLDTSFAVALDSKADQLHERASSLRTELKSEGARLLTTWAVLLEIGNALSRLRFRDSAIRLLTSLRTDRNVQILPLSSPLLDRAFELFSTRRDKQ
jgi:hypothetical protein